MINKNFGPIGLQKCMNSNKNINKNEIENENLRFSVRDIINIIKINEIKIWDPELYRNVCFEIKIEVKT